MNGKAWLTIIPLGLSLQAGAQPNAPRMRLVEEMRIDGARENLSGIGFVVVGPDGRIAFSEPQDFRLRFYDAAGKEFSRYGRKGGGPGEFGLDKGYRPPSAQLTGGVYGDTTWVFDRTLRRFTFFSRDGKFVRTLPQPGKLPDSRQRASESAVKTLISFQSIAPLSGGRLLGRARYGTLKPRLRSDGSSVLMQGDLGTEFAIASPAGDIVRTLGLQPKNESMVEVERSNGLASWGTAVPFQIQPYDAVSQDGSRFGFVTTQVGAKGSGTFDITVIGVAGDTLLARSYPFTGMPIAQTSVDSAVRRTMAGYRPARGAPPPVPPDVADEMEAKIRAAIPAVAAPIWGMRFGADNTIWLALASVKDGRPYLILSDRGDPIGTVILPTGVSLSAANKTTIWAIVRDADDLPSLVRYRLERGR